MADFLAVALGVLVSCAILSLVGAVLLLIACRIAGTCKAKPARDDVLGILLAARDPKKFGTVALFRVCWIASLCGYVASAVVYGVVLLGLLTSESYLNASVQTEYAVQALTSVLGFVVFLPCTLFLLPGRFARPRVGWACVAIALVLTYAIGPCHFFAAANAAAFANGRRIMSDFNLLQIARAMEFYARDHNGQFPPQAICGPGGEPLLSWRVLILPYLEQDQLYRKFNLDEPWDSPHNKPLAARMPRNFLLRGGQASREGCMYYQTVLYEQTDQGGHKPARTTPFHGTQSPIDPDRRGRTLLVVEAGDSVPWTKPVDLVYRDGEPLPKFGGVTGRGFSGVIGSKQSPSNGNEAEPGSPRVAWASVVYSIPLNLDESQLRSLIGGLPSPSQSTGEKR